MRNISKNQLGYALTLWALAFLAGLVVSTKGLSQNQGPPEKQPVIYFPAEAGGTAQFFAPHLQNHGEPSLLGISRDPATHSYRISWLAGGSGRSLLVRLALSRNGSGEITSIENFVSENASRTTQRKVVSPDVDKFLDLLQESNFWGLPTQEDSSPTNKYKMDVDMWLFEGARDGRYHVVYRAGPYASHFTDMVRFLTKDLAGLDEKAIPHPFGASTEASHPHSK